MQIKEGQEERTYPYTIQNLPITVTIPYNFRWRVLQAKLMLADLKELCEKYGIVEACSLYETVRTEIGILMKKLKEEIEAKREKIGALIY